MSSLKGVNIEEAIDHARDQLQQEKNISAAFRSAMEVILLLLGAMVGRLNVNSKNSSKPPSQDPHRKKESKAGSSGRKPGGQKGRIGKRLEPSASVDVVVPVAIDRSTLPLSGHDSQGEPVKRPVIDVVISKHVTAYQLEVLVDNNGKRYIASAPAGVRQDVQYGASVKALSCYMSPYQLLPYARIENFFSDQVGIPLSQGSLFNFNKEAYEALASFETEAKAALQQARVAHADETGVNIDGKLHGMHVACHEPWTLISAHSKRGKEAMDKLGIWPSFKGVFIHDHWKPYYQYSGCRHALCHAHHLRELTAVFEQEPQCSWAKEMHDFLINMNILVQSAGGSLSLDEYKVHRAQYRQILKTAEQQCPPPPEAPPDQKKRGRVKRSKARNLLERFIKYEMDMLRFIWIPYVPFTNNQGERDIRMLKVQQKVSGCFKTLESANSHARIRSFILSEQKQGRQPSSSLNTIFQPRQN